MTRLREGGSEVPVAMRRRVEVGEETVGWTLDSAPEDDEVVLRWK